MTIRSFRLEVNAASTTRESLRGKTVEMLQDAVNAECGKFMSRLPESCRSRDRIVSLWVDGVY